MAAAPPQKSLCTRCECKYETVRVLECRHMLCERCYNKLIEESLKQGRDHPNRVKCVTCGQNSGILETDDVNIVTGMGAVSLTSRFGSGVAGKKKCKKLWRCDKYKNTCDLTFYGDRKVAFITYDRDDQGKKTNPQLRTLDIDGKPFTLPFSASFKKPLAVASSADMCLFVVDWPAECNTQILMYRETARDWSCHEFSTTHRIQRIAILPNGRIVGTTTHGSNDYVKLVIFEADGKEVLAVDLPPPPATCETNFVVEVATSPAGLVIISDPNTDTVCVRDESGRTLTTFNSSLFRHPGGICTDSAGDVLIYDDEDNSVSLYTHEGIYQRRIVKPEIVAMGLSLYQDRYLLVRDSTQGIILYELK